MANLFPLYFFLIGSDFAPPRRGGIEIPNKNGCEILSIKDGLTKKRFGVPAALLIILLMSTGVASAALLDVYGVIKGTGHVNKSVTLIDTTGSPTDEIVYSFDGIYAGSILENGPFMIKNRGENLKAEIRLVTVQRGDGKTGGYNNVIGIETCYKIASSEANLHGREPIKLEPGENIKIIIVNRFASGLEPGDYAIKTRIEPKNGRGHDRED